MWRLLLIPMLAVSVAVGLYAAIRRHRGGWAWGGGTLAAQVVLALGLVAMTELELAGIESETAVVALFFLPVLLGGGGAWALLRVLPKG